MLQETEKLEVGQVSSQASDVLKANLCPGRGEDKCRKSGKKVICFWINDSRGMFNVLRPSSHESS